jgi:hypothetical protein
MTTDSVTACKLVGTNGLYLGFRRWKIAGHYFVLKAGAGVGAIAKRFVLRLAAAAEADYGTASKAESLACGIEDFKVAFNPHGAVIIHCDFRCWHESRC